MKFLVATPVVLFVVWLAVGAVTGRVKARSCCSIPADRDLRLRDVAVPTAAPEGAVPAEPAGTTPPRV